MIIILAKVLHDFDFQMTCSNNMGASLKFSQEYRLVINGIKARYAFKPSVISLMLGMSAPLLEQCPNAIEIHRTK
jgi:hypothetical protein